MRDVNFLCTDSKLAEAEIVMETRPEMHIPEMSNKGNERLTQQGYIFRI